MRFKKFLCALFLALFSLQTFAPLAIADEGMWTFNNVPRAEIKRQVRLRCHRRVAAKGAARFGALQQRRLRFVCFGRTAWC